MSETSHSEILQQIYEEAKANIAASVKSYGSDIECEFKNPVLNMLDCPISIEIKREIEQTRETVKGKYDITNYVESDKDGEAYAQSYGELLESDEPLKVEHLVDAAKTIFRAQKEHLCKDYEIITESGNCAGYYYKCEDCNGEGDLICGNCMGKRRVMCGRCDGSGFRSTNSGLVKCSSCNGNGYVVCRHCNGKGIVKCESCGGTGYFSRLFSAVYRTTITVKYHSFGDELLDREFAAEKDLSKIFVEPAANFDISEYGAYQVVKHAPEIKFDVLVKAKDASIEYKCSVFGRDARQVVGFNFSKDALCFETLKNYAADLPKAEQAIRANPVVSNIAKTILNDGKTIGVLADLIASEGEPEKFDKNLKLAAEKIEQDEKLKDLVKYFTGAREFLLFCVPIVKMANDCKKAQESKANMEFLFMFVTVIMPFFYPILSIFAMIGIACYQIWAFAETQKYAEPLYGEYPIKEAQKSRITAASLAAILGSIVLYFKL